MGSSAAATCVSAWVSTPPVMARRSSTMVMPSLFLWLKGWHAPAGRRTREPRPLAQDGQIRPARRWVPQEPGPGRQIGSQDSPKGASADSEVRPGPRLPTLRPHHRKTTEAGPGRKHYPHSPCRLCPCQPPRRWIVRRVQNVQFWLTLSAHCALIAATCRRTWVPRSCRRPPDGYCSVRLGAQDCHRRIKGAGSVLEALTVSCSLHAGMP